MQGCKEGRRRHTQASWDHDEWGETHVHGGRHEGWGIVANGAQCGDAKGVMGLDAGDAGLNMRDAGFNAMPGET